MRTAAALSQEELAEHAGLSARGISDLERGARQKPRPETVRLLADVLAPDELERAAFLAAASGAHLEAGDFLGPRQPAAWPCFSGAFFGRDDELAALTVALVSGEQRVVTITGPGGTGKTRFALEAARQVRDHFRDGVVFVDLAPITDAQLVMPTIVRVVGGDDVAGESSWDRLAARLHHEHLLVILDNCEQILAALAGIGRVLDACPGVMILATSRAALGLRGEREWPLAPLPIPDLDQRPSLSTLRHTPAVALFARRATDAVSTFYLSEQNIAAVAAICQQVEGLPLAIELAAARCKLLSVAELAARLHHRLPLLTGGPRNAPARQQTLRATIAWSYDLLTDDEQAGFRQLSVFVGGWTLEAAEAVIQTPAATSVLDVLSALQDQHLIRVNTTDAQTWFSMLETIREFATELLTTSSELDAAMDRQATYCLVLAQQGAIALETAEQRLWLERLDAEQPNLRQALDHLESRGDHRHFAELTVALSLYWDMRSNAAEGLPRLRIVLSRESGDTLLRAQALVGAAAMGYVIGAYAEAMQWLRETERISRRFGSANTLIQALMQQGGIAERMGDEAIAAARFHESMELALATGNTWALSYVYPYLSDAAYRRGELDLAEQYGQLASDSIRDTNNLHLRCMNLGCLAQVWLARGNVAGAAEAFAESLAIAVDLGMHWNIANAMAGAAAVAAATGRFDDAALLLGAAEAACAATGHPKLPQFHLFAQTMHVVTDALLPRAFQDMQTIGRAMARGDATEKAEFVLLEIQDDVK